MSDNTHVFGIQIITTVVGKKVSILSADGKKLVTGELSMFAYTPGNLSFFIGVIDSKTKKLEIYEFTTWENILFEDA